MTTRESDDVSAADTTVEPRAVFANLADIVYQGSGLDEVHPAICIAATMIVPGCDHASILLKRKGEYVTVAATDAVAQRVDDFEREIREGPCVDAIEEESAQIEPDLGTFSQWPTLATRLLAETPVRGMMAFRLMVDQHKVGALNLFSDTPGAFDTDAAGRAIIMASFASVAAAAASRGEDALGLRSALQSNREIGKAVGMLMVLNDIDEERAFEVLRRSSQDFNIKLTDVAKAVIASRGKHPTL